MLIIILLYASETFAYNVIYVISLNVDEAQYYLIFI